MLNPSLQNSLNLSVQIAAGHKHEYVKLEHMLFALLKDQDIKSILTSCNVDIKVLETDLADHLKKKIPKLPNHVPLTQDWKPEPSVAFHRTIQRAAVQVQSSERKEIKSEHILLSFFDEPQSHALFFLKKQGLNVLSLRNHLSHGRSQGLKVYQNGTENAGQAQQQVDPLEAFTVNLTERARKKLSDPLIGREKNIERSLQVLLRRTKNNPLFIGEPGVGKTALADGIAQKIVSGKVPKQLQNAEIFSLDMGSLLAGTKFRGEFEARLKAVVKRLSERPKAILFIDEIHTIIGAGSTSGGSMDASNLLKPALASGGLSCIGSTTFKEYQQHFEKDRALSRRFQKIDVHEPSRDEATQILEGLKTRYEKHHRVKYSSESLKAAVSLSAQHIHARRLPDKAIDVIDEAGARARMNTKSQKIIHIEQTDIEQVIASIAQIPEKSVSKDETTQLKTLDTELKKVIYGQDKAIDKIVAHIKMSRTGLSNKRKPIGSFLFAGPTGVGKTEVVRQLSEQLGVNMLRFDMSEYMEKHAVSRLVGAPPGYVGYEQGGLLTEAVTKTPYSIILFDEIEKAHPDLINILLQVMDNATLTDSNGKKVYFENTILVMTSNAGAFEASRGTMGISSSESSKLSLEAIKRFFKPEFINRLDAVIEFKSLTKDLLLNVIDKFIDELSQQLKDKDIQLQVTDNAKEWIYTHGLQPGLGARPFSRFIDDQIKKELVDEILFGELSEGGFVNVVLKDDQLDFITKPLIK